MENKFMPISILVETLIPLGSLKQHNKLQRHSILSCHLCILLLIEKNNESCYNNTMYLRYSFICEIKKMNT